MDFELSEEVELFRDSVHKWVNQECPKDWCRELERKEHVYPQELWDKLTEAGFHGVGIAEEYGGLGGDIVIQATFMREFSRNAAGLAWIWGITSFSGAKSIGFYGTEEQKRRFLPKMAAGELKTAISFTEAGGGTDLLGGMKTSAEKVDGGWVINGEKIWSTTADTADYLLLIARSDKNVQRRTDGVSLFFVPRESEGITTTPLPKLGMRALSSCTVNLDNVFVPDDLLLGEEGKAWKDTTKTLNNERIMMSAMCLGMIDGVLEDAIEYMNQRRAFGKLIGEFQTLQHYIAKIAMFQKQTELMLYNTAWLQSQGRPCAMEAAMTKTIASEYACKAADMGISILGGMGYSAETDMQRYWRDARLLRIGPVSNEMAQNMIAEGLGLPRSF
ncbi:MAG: acyl-CoA/acyl-ACP dehydrogenase [Proteobacteria bacterium]|nr:acyl-CoA/acyl-ACP dehydrogenase [Pseudomonadota bacterium]